MPHGVKQSLSEGFKKFVVKTDDGCWGWKGCAPKNPGYGQFRSHMKIWRAHVASYVLHIGEIPEGKFVCHTCDNRICSNPKHLFLATDLENKMDMVQKERSPILYKKGCENPNAKLQKRQVEEIKKMLSSGITQKIIAQKFSVSQSLISLICLGKAWR